MAKKIRVSKNWPTGKPLDSLEGVTIDEKNLTSYLLALKEEDITYSFIMTLFGEFGDKRLCNPYDTFSVPAKAYQYNKKGKIVSNSKAFVSTIGLWVYNIFFFRDSGLAEFVGGYINHTINDKSYKGIDQDLSYALLENKISTEQFQKYMEKTQFMMPFESVLSPNQTEFMMCATKEIDKKKAELYKKYKKDLDEGNIAVAEKMEKELLAFAAEYMEGDPSLDTLESGGGGSFKNNFKNMFIMKGAMRDPDPNAKKQYNIALSNYMDGISADEYSIIANSLAAGPYSRGKKTETGGYWEKLMVSGYQHIRLDKPGSDCGTKHYITVTLDKSNYKDYMYNYIIVGNNLVELTTDNLDRFMGKTVKMRFASMCKRAGGAGMICNCCAGNMFYRIGIENIGVAVSQVASTMKLRCMKGFHDSTVSTSTIDLMKAFSLK